MRLSHCQRARSAVFAVVPLWRAPWTRWPSVVSKALFSAVHATQRIGPTDKPLPSRLQKISSPVASASPLEDPDALGDDSSFFAMCFRMLRCKLACILPSSSLDPRLASGAFAVAKDDNRDRFIGDRRSLNSREKSIGRAHLHHCPGLRRLKSARSETVQITIRDTNYSCTWYLLPAWRSR